MPNSPLPDDDSSTPTVAVYSKPQCTACTNVKRWLNDRQISFDEFDITTPENLELAKAHAVLEAPMVVVNDAPAEIIFSGFRPDVLAHCFPAEWYPKVQEAA